MFFGRPANLLSAALLVSAVATSLGGAQFAMSGNFAFRNNIFNAATTVSAPGTGTFHNVSFTSGLVLVDNSGGAPVHLLFEDCWFGGGDLKFTGMFLSGSTITIRNVTFINSYRIWFDLVNLGGATITVENSFLPKIDMSRVTLDSAVVNIRNNVVFLMSQISSSFLQTGTVFNVHDNQFGPEYTNNQYQFYITSSECSGHSQWIFDRNTHYFNPTYTSGVSILHWDTTSPLGVCQLAVRNNYFEVMNPNIIYQAPRNVLYVAEGGMGSHVTFTGNRYTTGSLSLSKLDVAVIDVRNSGNSAYQTAVTLVDFGLSSSSHIGSRVWFRNYSSYGSFKIKGETNTDAKWLSEVDILIEDTVFNGDVTILESALIDHGSSVTLRRITHAPRFPITGFFNILYTVTMFGSRVLVEDSSFTLKSFQRWYYVDCTECNVTVHRNSMTQNEFTNMRAMDHALVHFHDNVLMPEPPAIVRANVGGGCVYGRTIFRWEGSNNRGSAGSQWRFEDNLMRHAGVDPACPGAYYGLETVYGGSYLQLPMCQMIWKRNTFVENLDGDLDNRYHLWFPSYSLGADSHLIIQDNWFEGGEILLYDIDRLTMDIRDWNASGHFNADFQLYFVDHVKRHDGTSIYLSNISFGGKMFMSVPAGFGMKNTSIYINNATFSGKYSKFTLREMDSSSIVFFDSIIVNGTEKQSNLAFQDDFAFDYTYFVGTKVIIQNCWLEWLQFSYGSCEGCSMLIQNNTMWQLQLYNTQTSSGGTVLFYNNIFQPGMIDTLTHLAKVYGGSECHGGRHVWQGNQFVGELKTSTSATANALLYYLDNQASCEIIVVDNLFDVVDNDWQAHALARFADVGKDSSLVYANNAHSGGWVQLLGLDHAIIDIRNWNGTAHNLGNLEFSFGKSTWVSETGHSHSSIVLRNISVGGCFYVDQLSSGSAMLNSLFDFEDVTYEGNQVENRFKIAYADRTTTVRFSGMKNRRGGYQALSIYDNTFVSTQLVIDRCNLDGLYLYMNIFDNTTIIIQNNRFRYVYLTTTTFQSGCNFFFVDNEVVPDYAISPNTKKTYAVSWASSPFKSSKMLVQGNVLIHDYWSTSSSGCWYMDTNSPTPGSSVTIRYNHMASIATAPNLLSLYAVYVYNGDTNSKYQMYNNTIVSGKLTLQNVANLLLLGNSWRLASDVLITFRNGISRNDIVQLTNITVGGHVTVTADSMFANASITVDESSITGDLSIKSALVTDSAFSITRTTFNDVFLKPTGATTFSRSTLNFGCNRLTGDLKIDNQNYYDSLVDIAGNTFEKRVWMYQSTFNYGTLVSISKNNFENVLWQYYLLYYQDASSNDGAFHCITENRFNWFTTSFTTDSAMIHLDSLSVLSNSTMRIIKNFFDYRGGVCHISSYMYAIQNAGRDSMVVIEGNTAPFGTVGGFNLQGMDRFIMDQRHMKVCGDVKVGFGASSVGHNGAVLYLDNITNIRYFDLTANVGEWLNNVSMEMHTMSAVYDFDIDVRDVDAQSKLLIDGYTNLGAVNTVNLYFKTNVFFHGTTVVVTNVNGGSIKIDGDSDLGTKWHIKNNPNLWGLQLYYAQITNSFFWFEGNTVANARGNLFESYYGTADGTEMILRNNRFLMTYNSAYVTTRGIIVLNVFTCAISQCKIEILDNVFEDPLWNPLHIATPVIYFNVKKKNELVIHGNTASQGVFRGPELKEIDVLKMSLENMAFLGYIDIDWAESDTFHAGSRVIMRNVSAAYIKSGWTGTLTTGVGVTACNDTGFELDNVEIGVGTLSGYTDINLPNPASGSWMRLNNVFSAKASATYNTLRISPTSRWWPGTAIQVTNCNVWKFLNDAFFDNAALLVRNNVFQKIDFSGVSTEMALDNYALLVIRDNNLSNCQFSGCIQFGNYWKVNGGAMTIIYNNVVTVNVAGNAIDISSLAKQMDEGNIIISKNTLTVLTPATYSCLASSFTQAASGTGIFEISHNTCIGKFTVYSLGTSSSSKTVSSHPVPPSAPCTMALAPARTKSRRATRPTTQRRLPSPRSGRRFLAPPGTRTSGVRRPRRST